MTQEVMCYMHHGSTISVSLTQPNTMKIYMVKLCSPSNNQRLLLLRCGQLGQDPKCCAGYAKHLI